MMSSELNSSIPDSASETNSNASPTVSEALTDLIDSAGDSSTDSILSTSSVAVDNSSEGFDYVKGIYDNTWSILMFLCVAFGALLLYLFGRFIYRNLI